MSRYDFEADGGGNDSSFAFTEKSIRHAFIRKVYSILLVQLMITLGFVAVFTFDRGTIEFVAKNSYLLWISIAVLFVTLIAMACCEGVRRTFPMNIIFLFLFTLAESFILGCVTASYKASEVFVAIAICVVLVIALTIFAFQTKIDFTIFSGVLFVATLVLIIFGIVLIFWQGRIVNLIYSCLGAFIFMAYIVVDTQLMMGGHHRYSISPEDYIFAALDLYLDIINLFIYILNIIALTRS